MQLLCNLKVEQQYYLGKDSFLFGTNPSVNNEQSLKLVQGIEKTPIIRYIVNMLFHSIHGVELTIKDGGCTDSVTLRHHKEAHLNKGTRSSIVTNKPCSKSILPNETSFSCFGYRNRVQIQQFYLHVQFKCP